MSQLGREARLSPLRDLRAHDSGHQCIVKGQVLQGNYQTSVRSSIASGIALRAVPPGARPRQESSDQVSSGGSGRPEAALAGPLGVGWSEGRNGSSPGGDCAPSRQPAGSTEFGGRDGRHMVTADSAQAGSRLDEHHAPETNGRMAVCRRCGTQTDSPGGLHHIPTERQLVRSNEWLITQARTSYIDRARAMRGK